MTVGIDLLQQAPEAYEGRFIRVTGELRRAPVVVCDGLVRLPPATWRLAQGEYFTAAGGYENLVPELLPAGITMTVDGVWRFWRGPVGCGKGAPLQRIWYLAVTNVVSPSPVARVTLTPVGGVEAPTPEGEATAAASATFAGPPSQGTPLREPSPAATTPPTTPGASQPTSTRSAATLPPEEATATPQTTETVEATATGESDDLETVTATVEAGDGATPTMTPTVGATATPGGSTVDKGRLPIQDLEGDRLGSDEAHSWEFEVRAGDQITISVAAQSSADITLTILNDRGNRIHQQNNSGAGQIERIEAWQAPENGVYRLLIAEAAGATTYYALLLLNSSDEEYSPFIFAGMLSYGTSANGNLAADTDQFWFFFGQQGEVVTVNVSPQDQSDLLIDLFGPPGELLEGGVDRAGSGGAEQLRNVVLPETGLYGILVGEVFYDPARYTVLVSRN